MYLCIFNKLIVGILLHTWLLAHVHNRLNYFIQINFSEYKTGVLHYDVSSFQNNDDMLVNYDCTIDLLSSSTMVTVVSL